MMKISPHRSYPSHARFNRFKRLFLTEFQQLLKIMSGAFFFFPTIRMEKLGREERNLSMCWCVKMNENFEFLVKSKLHRERKTFFSLRRSEKLFLWIKPVAFWAFCFSTHKKVFLFLSVLLYLGRKNIVYMKRIHFTTSPTTQFLPLNSVTITISV